MRAGYVLLVSLFAATATVAAEPPGAADEELRFLAGTTLRDESSGQFYAYLVWQAQNTALLRDRAFAVYSKDGDAASAADYAQVKTCGLQTKPAILNAILEGAPADLLDAAALEETIDALFGKLMPAVSLSFAEKLAIVLQVARHEQEVFDRLYFISRSEPVIGICLGTAALIEVGSEEMTFEVRAGAGGAAAPGGVFSTVIGRVSLDPGSPRAIPAPPAPVHVPEDSPQGHLNARLRWDITDDLKRLTPVTYGFNVYRILRGFAEAKGYDTAPPPASAIEALVEASQFVARVNEFPVMPSEPMAFYLLDNNDAFEAGGVPFSDGDQFYYYVAAADLLGRPGDLSDGTLVTICDRMPALAPGGLRVTNRYSYNAATQSADQRLEVSWEASANASSDPPDSYQVYRWENLEQMHALAAAPPSPVGAPIPHDPATRRYAIVDVGGTAPGVPADLNKTYWYSVRALQNTACGQLASGDSAPAFGVLREREGPPAGNTTLTVSRRCPEYFALPLENIGIGQFDTSSFVGNPFDAFPVVLRVNRTSDSIKTAQLAGCPLFIQPGETPIDSMATRSFGTEDQVEFGFWAPAEAFQKDVLAYLLCVTDDQGKSIYLKQSLGPFEGNANTALVFNVRVDQVADERTINNGITGGTIPVHDPSLPDAGGALNPVRLEFTMTPTAREFKLYKRINGGPLILVEQGTDEEFTVAPIEIEDPDLPAHSAEICYFLQYFDEHGNPSPLMDMGCFLTASRTPPPQPMISDVRSEGTGTSPRAVLEWFCPPDGVERFNVYISEGLTRIPTDFGDGISPITSPVIVAPLAPGLPPTTSTLTAPVVTRDGIPYRVYKTGRVGGTTFGNPATPGEFELSLDVRSGVDYRVFIEAVSAAGNHGPPSTVMNFSWSQAEEPVALDIPWPARGLPPTTDATDFHPDIKAQLNLRDNYVNREEMALVRIGEILSTTSIEIPEFSFGSVGTEGGGPGGANLAPSTFPDDGEHSIELFTTGGGETVLPCVLYRYQVPSARFPEVSGDVVQVSPLIDRIRTRDVGGVFPRTEILDPFVDLYVDPDYWPDPRLLDPNRVSLYIKDTQGVVKGATYVYLLVLYKENMEIDRVLKTNELAIPESVPNP